MRPAVRFSAHAFLLTIRILRSLVVILIALAAYEFAIEEIVGDGRAVFGLFLLWFLTGYFLLPRIHRKLTRLYLPDYFIGRVRTADGLLGDPVNLVINGTKQQLIRSMKEAGWEIADEVTLSSSIAITKASLLRKSYPTAPMSPLFLFGRKQDLAFQQEVAGNPRQRHHVRFWRCPRGWKLPGGVAADWLGAATFDRSVGFSLFTLQITHKIAENTDVERDYVTDSLSKVGASLHVIKDYSSGYHHRNGGGDKIKTDGAMPIVSLRR